MVIVLIPLTEDKSSDPLIVSRIIGRFEVSWPMRMPETIDQPSLNGVTQEAYGIARAEEPIAGGVADDQTDTEVNNEWE